MSKVYGLAIIGGGPAGLTAAVYAARGGLSVCIVEKLYCGGQAATTPEVENFPGFLNISGMELVMKMQEQVDALKVEIIYDEMTGGDFSGDIKKVKLAGGEIEAKSVLLAVGATPRKLEIEGEESHLGRGVSYCATCDGNFFKGKKTAVIGGGNTALEDALYLSDICEKVYLVHRRDEFRGSKILSDKVLNNEKIEFIGSAVPLEIYGEPKVEALTVKSVKDASERKIEVSGIFVAVGLKPNTDVLRGLVELNEGGYIVADEKMETSVSGVYAAGDARVKQLRQIVTACSDGAIAAENAIARAK